MTFRMTFQMLFKVTFAMIIQMPCRLDVFFKMEMFSQPLRSHFDGIFIFRFGTSPVFCQANSGPTSTF